MEKQSTLKTKSISGVIWLGIRFGGSQLVRFVIGVILARLLDPAYYTVLALITVFTGLAEKFVTHGFAMALIQAKEADDTDCSSVFWASLAIALVLMAALFFAAPWIAAFYAYPVMTQGLRVLSLTLAIGALSAVLNARLSRELEFKKMSIASIVAMIASGATGVTLAFLGYGLWALIWQQLVSELTICVVELIMTRWLPGFRIRLDRLKRLFSYGWKVLAGNLLGNLYGTLTELVLGKVFPGETLAFYNKGKQMPSLVSDNMNTIVQTTLFPTFAAHQDDRARELDLVQKTNRLNAFVVFPLMTGLALVAEPLIGLLLTDKWLPAAAYMLPAAILWALYPLDCTLMQSICATGRSGLHLIVEISRRAFGLIALCVAAFGFRTPMAIAWSVTITGVFSMAQSMLVARRFYGYRLRTQIADMLPPLALCAAMAALVWPLSLLGLARLPLLIAQAVVGAGAYVGLAALFKLKVFKYFCGAVAEYVQKLKQKRVSA